ncbi:hypothetical protein ACHQM5_004324 [Ranunculus cassubicifolius]
MRLEAQTSLLQQSVANIASQQRSNNPRPHNGSNRGRFTNGPSNRPRPTGPSNRSQPPRNVVGPCQLCGRKNHVVADCWFRFDKAFYPHATSPQTAYIATPGSALDANWTPDTGATNHLTPDFSNLHISSTYEGPDSIRVGNGSNLPIENIGLQHNEGGSNRN